LKASGSSRPDREFGFIIPGPSAQQVFERNFSQMAKKSPLRVLIVDDERLIRWSIAETLEHVGHIIIEAADGAAAVRSLTNPDEPVDAVVLDYRLPDSNDLALLAHIRRLSPRSAVILMTAFGTPEITTAALDLGVYQVLNKPFDMHHLQSLLLQACGSKEPPSSSGSAV
jgi:DNA-binding NtrC family response regulator